MKNSKPYIFNKLEGTKTTQKSNIEILKQIDTNIEFKIGTSCLKLDDVLKMTEDTLIELDTVDNTENILVDVSVQGKSIAIGEIVLVNDKPFVKIKKILKNK